MEEAILQIFLHSLRAHQLGNVILLNDVEKLVFWYIRLPIHCLVIVHVSKNYFKAIFIYVTSFVWQEGMIPSCT